MDMGTTLDLLPTFANLSHAKLPQDRVYDGFDLTPLLVGTGKSGRETVFYYHGTEVFAIRWGDYKAHFFTQNEYGTQTAHPITVPPTEIAAQKTEHEIPLLFNLSEDPGERINIADNHPEIIAKIRNILQAHKQTIVAVENQLEK